MKHFSHPPDPAHHGQAEGSTKGAPAASPSAEYQLAPFEGQRPDAPDWACEVLAVEPERTMVAVEGAAIEVLAWGARDLPGIVLLHGSRANADWWAITAPLLMRDYRVIALSSSGTGHSDRRDRYSVTQFAREVIAVADTQRLFDNGRKPVLVAHSFGGYAALRAANLAARQIGGVVLIDTLLHDVSSPEQPWRQAQPEKARTYATIAHALSRFRLIPARETECLWALDEIARRSVRQIASTGQWTWQFDNALFANLEQENLSQFNNIEAPVAVVRGEFSALYGPEIRGRIAELFGTDIPDIVIPQAGHHIMIDQPLALVAALRALLGTWPPSPGRDRRSRLGVMDSDMQQSTPKPAR